MQLAVEGPELEAAATRRSSPADADTARKTSKPEVLKRFSAYRNDHRLTAGGGFQPGTYTTTAADALHAPTGSRAVERFALPNPAPAIYLFTIHLSAGWPVQRGTVQPANGQPGGGVEVILTAGSPNGTVTGPAVIPP